MPIFNPSPSSSAEGNTSNPRRRPSWSSLAKPALGVALTLGVLTTGQAQAFVVTVGGVQYNVTTFTGSYNDHKSKFAQTPGGGVMPWWGDSSLATQFSNALGYSLGTPNSIETLSAGSRTNMDVGPYFAYNSIVDKITFLLTDTAATYHPNTSPLIFSVDLNSSVTWAQVAPKREPRDTEPSTVPGPVPAIGAFAAFGFSRKLRKRIKLSTNISASLYGS
jgi:hypothetical protein